MARYIDADGLLDYLDIASAKEQGDLPRDFYDGVGFACYEIENFPLSDVAPVVHSRWFPYNKQMLICDNCAHYWIAKGDQYDFKYCPNCGARMDEEVEP